MPEFLTGDGGSDLSGLKYLVWHDALELLGAAANDSDGRAFRRLVAFGVLAALVLALACLLVIVWRAELPWLPELPIPVLLV